MVSFECCKLLPIQISTIGSNLNVEYWLEIDPSLVQTGLARKE